MIYDAVGQEISFGDLVIFRRQYRRASLRYGKIVSIGFDTVKIAFPTIKYESGGYYNDYMLTGNVSSGNCVVMEREFIQPELKEKLAEWSNKKRKKPLHEFLNFSKSEVFSWAGTRCLPLER